VTLRVLEAGPPEGPPVVLLHGWAVSAYLWRQNIPALAAAGYRVYAPDLPGHGQSDAPLARGDYSLAAMTARVTLLLDALSLGETALVAQSMGGRIALEVARRSGRRVSRLALFGPVGFGDVPPARAYVPFVPPLPGSLLANLIPRELVDVIQRRVYGKLGWFTERDIDEYWAPTQFADVVSAQLQMLREFEWAPHEAAALAAFPTPTLVVFGTRDRTVRPVHAERLVAAMPHARLHWIEEGGHTVMEEVPHEVNALLQDFLGVSPTAE
jgi:pimeloyl-ACP methyl ester carboxylesterase